MSGTRSRAVSLWCGLSVQKMRCPEPLAPPNQHPGTVGDAFSKAIVLALQMQGPGFRGRCSPVAPRSSARGFGGNSELPPRCKLHYLVTFARRAFGAGKGDASLVGWAIISRSCCAIAASSQSCQAGKILYEKVFCARGRMENLGELTDSCINSVVPRQNAQSGYRSR
jgi:hypothetical protein